MIIELTTQDVLFVFLIAYFHLLTKTIRQDKQIKKIVKFIIKKGFGNPLQDEGRNHG
jgi:CRISPR/Cas system-associated protein endoribonuclease Cas2